MTADYKKYNRAAAQSPNRKVAPPAPLTPAQQAHAEKMKALWQEYFPGDQFLKELHGLGLIDGYRNILSITPHEADHGAA